MDKRFIRMMIIWKMNVDIDSLINNMNNFYHWCDSRVLSLEEKYVIKILISGMEQQ